MHPLTELIRSDMKPALGVTEPGAIAYAVSTAASYVTGALEQVSIRLNSGIYKNAFTCGIPNSKHLGNVYAAALGAVAGDPKLGLESLANVTADDNRAAEALVAEGRVRAEMSEISSRIHIVADVTRSSGTATVTIWDAHTNITCIEVNGDVVFGHRDSNTADTDGTAASVPAEDTGNAAGTAGLAEGIAAAGASYSMDIDELASLAGSEIPLIHRYTLAEMMTYVDTVPAEEIGFIRAAYDMNKALFEEGLRSDRTPYLHYLLAQNGGLVFSEDEQATASLLCNGSIEARVIGLDQPAMSITGSGAHGIIATMPLYAASILRKLPEETLLRATALSYLICMYIKEYSGRLSAFCGCAIAAGTGMACGLIYLSGGDIGAMQRCINNMASSITGMICDGGNHGCTMKGIVACDAAFRSADLAIHGICIEKEHGINGSTPEATMRNMGQIASPGMVATEGTIVDIMQRKQEAEA